MRLLTCGSKCLISGLLFYLFLAFCPNVLAQTSQIQVTALGESQISDTTQISQAPGCVRGNGRAVTQLRSFGEFSQISIDGTFRVHIELQRPNTLTVIGDENLLPHFVTHIEGHKLLVSAQGSICPQVTPEIRVTKDSLAKLSASGAVEIHVSHMENKTFMAHLDGASDLNLMGRSESLTAMLSGSNTLQADEFETQDTVITIDGAAEAVVNVSRKLIANINGVGDIRYTGSPSVVERHINGAGEVESQ